MTLTDIREILSERDLKLSKSLGQNFLHDQNQVRRIVAAAGIASGDKILEIGPGLGPLTEYLLQEGAEVLAIEKDQRLFDFLQQKFSAMLHVENNDGIPPPASALSLPARGERAGERGSQQPAPHVQLLHADALDYVKANRNWSGWKLVSNLPYSVASPILVELAQAETPPDRMVATLQIEVAKRIAAEADDEDYGILGLLIRLHYDCAGWFKIPPSSFFPEPDVDSACITLNRHPVPLLAPELRPVYVKLVKCAFSQRRKMMMKLLKQIWPEPRLTAAFQTLGISPQIRAEAVPLAQFVRLTELLR